MPSLPTPDQSEASRRNGSRSDGPVTAAGKARSALERIPPRPRRRSFFMLPDEDPQEFRRREAEWLAEWRPRDHAEREAALAAVRAMWREIRGDRLEALVLGGLELLAGYAGGADLSSFPLDGPLPDLPETEGSKSRQQLITDLARRENLTIRQHYQTIAGARGHWQLGGHPFRSPTNSRSVSASRGPTASTSCRPPCRVGSSTTSSSWSCPSSCRRGLFRAEYEGRTLRENLGLALPIRWLARGDRFDPRNQAA